MKNLYKNKRQQGFTIIEVMIVLAIAAVILLIVLLAVPALERSSRNTQRNNDAAQLASAINTCLANHNSVLTSCESIQTFAVDIDFTKLGQIQSADYGASCSPSLTNACWLFGKTCNAAGTGTQNATTREFAVTYNIETTAGGNGTMRCVAS
ncbi:MAG TPA: type II secretion system protein [Candidatus Saccharimonadales bacterium]|nr:type II secretion system protein [Candidatus Saccharimonadales bacterium]